MTYDPNQVHHAALENRGAGQLALHIHFERPHTPMSMGLFLGDLAMFMQGPDGIIMVPELHNNGTVVCLVPIEPTNEVRYFEAVSRCVRYVPPTGELPFMQKGNCLPVDGTSRMEH